MWYAFIVNEGREQNVKRELEAQREELELKELIVPEIDLKNKYSTFTGYVFLKLDLNDEKFNKILDTKNICSFLGNVGLDEIKNIKKHISGKDVIINRNFKINDLVLIKQGDLADIKGKIIKIDKNYATISPENFCSNFVKVSIKDLDVVNI